MASLFQPSINAIKSAITNQVAGLDPRRTVRRRTFELVFQDLLFAPTMYRFQTILLVGGFATSPFLQEELQSHVDGKGLRMFSPDGQT